MDRTKLALLEEEARSKVPFPPEIKRIIDRTDESISRFSMMETMMRVRYVWDEMPLERLKSNLTSILDEALSIVYKGYRNYISVKKPNEKISKVKRRFEDIVNKLEYGRDFSQQLYGKRYSPQLSDFLNIIKTTIRSIINSIDSASHRDIEDVGDWYREVAREIYERRGLFRVKRKKVGLKKEKKKKG